MKIAFFLGVLLALTTSCATLNEGVSQMEMKINRGLSGQGTGFVPEIGPPHD